jgi:predicted N-formylglutamate amidohydrolase
METLPPAVEVVNEDSRSPFVLLCEHASHFMPQRYRDLGLPASERYRHIAWDVGAADVARHLAGLVEAPLLLAGYSRLLIDINRPPGSPTSIPEVSEDTPIPGNLNLDANERARREQEFFWPYQNRVSALLDRRQAAAIPTIVIGIHSFTPVFRGFSRPWAAGILYRHSADLGHTMAEALGGMAADVAENEPYQVAGSGDYTIPVHGENRGLPAVLVEIRHDLIAEPQGARRWAERLAAVLPACAAYA